jgi:hypothetical protein
VVDNPGPMALWGLIVAGGLVIGSLPAFLGLIIIMPVLGHATWHLYRKMVAWIGMQVSLEWPPMLPLRSHPAADPPALLGLGRREDRYCQSPV